MLSRIDSAELTEWMSFYTIDPWGEQRGDERSAIVAATIANSNRKRGSPPIKVQDFMPYRDRVKVEPRKVVAAKIRAGMEKLRNRRRAKHSQPDG